MDSPFPSAVAEEIVEAILAHRPLSTHHLSESIPGVVALGVALPSSGHLTHVSLPISLTNAAQAPLTSLFPLYEPCLATEVASLQRGLVCSRSKCASFADIATLIGDGPCESVACVPLTDAAVPPGQSSLPWGALSVAFRSETITRDAVLAVHALAKALSAPDCRLRLQYHLDTVVAALLASPHPLEEPTDAQTSFRSSPATSEDIVNDAGPSQLPHLAALCCSADDAAKDVDTPLQQPASPTWSDASSDSGWSAASGTHATEEQHPVWLTFESPAIERNYTKWVAMHMRHLDPAATLFSCSYFAAMGVSPSFAMALRHPAAWIAGGAALIPMWLCLLPPTASFYLARREACLAVFHAFSLLWHMITLNGSSVLGPALFGRLGSSPAAFLSWQSANMLMFQMRWWQAVVVAIAMFCADVLAAAAPLCRLFISGDAPKATLCISAVVSIGALQLLAALAVLRLNERRMRRLFLEHLAEPPEKRRAKFWFLRRLKLLGEGGMPVAVEMPRSKNKGA